MYLQVFGAKTLEIIYISDYQAHGLLLLMLSMAFWTHFLILCIYTGNAKYRATIRKDSFTFVQDNTINEMVQTNSH